MKLSIVVPVYNVEAYIKKCLLSCINQKGVSKDDYEIIIVNDGTKDKSMEIVENTIQQLSPQRNITIINQVNKGLSEARNTGLKHVKGDYVWFVDSDDWIDEDSVENIISTLQRNNVDILQMPYKIVYEGSSKEDIVHVKSIATPISGKDCMKLTRLPNLAQSRIIRKSLLQYEDIRFTPGILHEDAELKPRLLYVTESVMTLDKPCYNYLKRMNNSITSSFTMRNAEGRWYGVKSMHDYSKDFSYKDKMLFNEDMNFNMYFVLTGLKKLNKEEKRQMIDEISKYRDIFKRLIMTLSPKKFIVYLMLCTAPKLVLDLYSR